MTKQLDSLLVMAYIVQRCVALSIQINTTKLQKLMYCGYGIALVRTGVRICDENPEVWTYGPVFPRTLRLMQSHGWQTFLKFDVSEVSENLPKEALVAIDEALRVFGQFAANQLVSWTHEEGSPWDIASHGGRILKEQIPLSLIEEYFSNHVVPH